ncbi:lactococcin 972 family bacteriocin [Curtobacterium flaccumfaciens]|uniref:lactococcin 972 family bacteriocin n=1 Tax=Curtobacterium TaxID=2034 RepID=UPI000F46EEDD|nr:MULTISPECIES: lactococcin 972 family bacteriocin [Curtobacterium]UXN20922.1 lactococcin 972 family bacteriocin [Curtobacterium flaccumfaciens pv. flaccumfaciens]
MFNMKNKDSSVVQVAAVMAGAALLGAIALPTSASASTPDGVGATSGGSAVIIGGEGTRVIVDDTVGNGMLRTTKKVGGGVWIYGIGGGNSYSYYDHSKKTHKSTACSGYDTSCNYSGWTKKGTRSVAKIGRTNSGNTAYWNVK